MNICDKSNLKRFREILLDDQYIKGENVDGYSDFESDSDTEYEGLTDVDESDDASTNEYISEQTDLSDSDIDNDNNLANIQPATVQKGEFTWSSHPTSTNSRISAAKIMKKKQAARPKFQVLSMLLNFFLRMKFLILLFFIQTNMQNNVSIEVKINTRFLRLSRRNINGDE